MADYSSLKSLYETFKNELSPEDYEDIDNNDENQENWELRSIPTVEIEYGYENQIEFVEIGGFYSGSESTSSISVTSSSDTYSLSSFDSFINNSSRPVRSCRQQKFDRLKAQSMSNDQKRKYRRKEKKRGRGRPPKKFN